MFLTHIVSHGNHLSASSLGQILKEIRGNNDFAQLVLVPLSTNPTHPSSPHHLTLIPVYVRCTMTQGRES